MKKVSYKGFNIESFPYLLHQGGYSVNGRIWKPSASLPIELIPLLPEEPQICQTEKEADDIFIKMAINWINENILAS